MFSFESFIGASFMIITLLEYPNHFLFWILQSDIFRVNMLIHDCFKKGPTYDI